MSQALLNTTGRISRNRIINPDSSIDQRNAGAVVPLLASTYNFAADRALGVASVSGKLSAQRYNIALGKDQPTNSSLKYTVVSQYTPGSTDIFSHQRRLEGQFMVDLLWGSSFARPMVYTVCGMWPVAGAYSIAFTNGVGNRSYVTTFTVNQANTLETHSVVIPGDITGSWPVDTTSHTNILLSTGTGATNTTSTLNQWLAGNFYKAAGTVDLVSQANGSAMYIAWEQYERDRRTDFEIVPYDENLRKCQRYFWKTYNQGVIPGALSTSIYVASAQASSSYLSMSNTFPCVMRVPGTCVTYSATSGAIGKCSVDATDTPVSFSCSDSGFRFSVNNVITTVNQFAYFHGTVSAEL